MKQNDTQPCCEKFKKVIGGQALIEGIMMRGPKKDAVVVWVLTNKVSKTKKLHPIVFIGFSALVGIVFSMG